MHSETVRFEGADGQTLVGRIDHPVGDVRGWAIFAHCFTCSKQSRAALRVSKGLAERGIGVLRFDFTGLGASEGGSRPDGEVGEGGEDVVEPPQLCALGRFIDTGAVC